MSAIYPDVRSVFPYTFVKERMVSGCYTKAIVSAGLTLRSDGGVFLREKTKVEAGLNAIKRHNKHLEPHHHVIDHFSWILMVFLFNI